MAGGCASTVKILVKMVKAKSDIFTKICSKKAVFRHFQYLSSFLSDEEFFSIAAFAKANLKCKDHPK